MIEILLQAPSGPACGSIYPKKDGAWMNAFGGQGKGIKRERVPTIKRMERHPFNIIYG